MPACVIIPNLQNVPQVPQKAMFRNRTIHIIHSFIGGHCSHVRSAAAFMMTKQALTQHNHVAPVCCSEEGESTTTQVKSLV